MTPTTTVGGRRLLLRAEGSATVGLGHVMRLLALGQAWLDAGGRVEAMIDAPDQLLLRYRAEGFVVRAPGDALAAEMRDDPAAVAAIDLPALRSTDLRALGEAAERTLVVDDLARLPAYPVGLVLNQNAHAEAARYRGPTADRLLMGLRYVLLRREFRVARARRVAPVGLRVLVTFGGGDPTGMTSRTLSAIEGLPGDLRERLEVRAIVGAANDSTDRLGSDSTSSKGRPRIIVERAVADMTEPMAWADLAITAGGSTVWELARTGCPALVIETSPPETALAAGLRAVDLFDQLGPEAELDEGTLSAAIGQRLLDAAWRERMARRGPELIDGQGATRVTEALAHLHAR